MSRLDSFIRRLEAQRACLDWACREIAAVLGPVLELGLGNGRTYDHLRARLPGRGIYAFDRQLAAHPDCVPDGEHLLLGDFADTLPAFRDRLREPAALIHADIGSGDTDKTAALAAWLGPMLAPLLAPSGLALSDQPLELADAVPVAPPAGVAAGRYFIYRRRL